MDRPVVRDRSDLPASSRKLDLIAPEEVAEAVEAVVAASFGIEPDALPAAVGRALGFARISDEFRDRVEAIVPRHWLDAKKHSRQADSRRRNAR